MRFWAFGCVFIMLLTRAGSTQEPPASSTPPGPDGNPGAAIKAGKQVYQRFCVTCHGMDGKGAPDVPKTLPVPPSDLSDAEWTHGGSDEQILAVIRDGTDKGMETYKDRLNDQRLMQLVEYVKSLGAGGTAVETTPAADVPANPVATSAESVKKGMQIYRRFCVKCHGVNGKGDTEMVEFLSTSPSDLTDGKWKYGDQDGNIFVIIRDGTPYDMESFKDRLGDEDMWHIVNYMRSFEKKS